MVCLGNICRSPIAEGVLKYKSIQAGLQWDIESAGTNSYHIGEAPHQLSQKVSLLHGIDIGTQKARRFTKEDFLQFDKIYAMAEDVIADMKEIAKDHWVDEKVDLLLNELEPGANKNVPDPWYGPEPGYHEVFELIEKACEKIVAKNLK
jgi:protein-tyrosine phosphatase